MPAWVEKEPMTKFDITKEAYSRQETHVGKEEYRTLSEHVEMG